MKKLIVAIVAIVLGGIAFVAGGSPAEASAIVLKPADVRGHVAQDLVQEVGRRYYRYRRGPRVYFYYGPYYSPYYYRPYRYRRYRYYRRCYWHYGRRYCRY